MFRELVTLILILKNIDDINGLGLNCGKPNLVANRITGGSKIERGEYPWMVAIFYKDFSEQNSGFKYTCGGTLVSSDKVVTAAHCVHNKKETQAVKPHQLLVELGAYDLQDDRESGRISLQVSEVRVHREWNPQSDRFTGDIAVLVFTEIVSFSRLIQPVCLKNRIENFGEGIVAGWGKNAESKKLYERFPSKAKISIVSTNEKCYRMSSALATIGWEDGFCAGATNVIVCGGDSGSGLVVIIDGIFYLKGIVSSSEVDLSTGCAVKNLALYTNVPKYIDFIDVDTQDSSTTLTTIPSTISTEAPLGLADLVGRVDSFFSCSRYDELGGIGCWYSDSGKTTRDRRAKGCSSTNNWQYQHSVLGGQCYCTKCP